MELRRETHAVAVRVGRYGYYSIKIDLSFALALQLIQNNIVLI